MGIEILFVIVTGLAFGSFVTMASWRLPRGEEMVVTPSHCPECNAKLTARDLFPLFSWIASRGKCRHCKKPVSIRYPLTELATAGAFLLVYSRYGITPEAFLFAAMAVTLLIMIVVDLEHYIIPDIIHIVLIPLALIFHYLRGTAWQDVAMSFAFSAGVGLLLHYGYRWLRKKEGLGFGDVKFLAVAGLWLTFQYLPAFLFLSGLLGVVHGLLWKALGKGCRFPFGPALAVSLFLCATYPEYTNLFWNMINSALITK